ncbi:hypothetical protein ACIGB8_23335 [Promicromonospora sukumoe]|uniref:hypothetical protein n=1 Tax=Promicromonospora sukumoe TaxID=88382 RepID=UPI0037C79B2F
MARPILIVLTDGDTKAQILARLQLAGEYVTEPVFDWLTVDGSYFEVDPTDTVLVEYEAPTLRALFPRSEPHTVTIEYGAREEVRPLLLEVTRGLEGVLDTTTGPFLRLSDLPASTWLARPGRPDSAEDEPLAFFEEHDLPREQSWQPVPDDTAGRRRARSVLAELERELVRGHPLFRRIVGVEAFDGASDDVLVRLDDGSYAIVHPTWTRRAERPGYPTCELLGTGAESALRFRQSVQWM